MGSPMSGSRTLPFLRLARSIMSMSLSAILLSSAVLSSPSEADRNIFDRESQNSEDCYTSWVNTMASIERCFEADSLMSSMSASLSTSNSFGFTLAWMCTMFLILRSEYSPW